MTPEKACDTQKQAGSSIIHIFYYNNLGSLQHRSKLALKEDNTTNAILNSSLLTYRELEALVNQHFKMRTQRFHIIPFVYEQTDL